MFDVCGICINVIIIHQSYLSPEAVLFFKLFFRSLVTPNKMAGEVENQQMNENHHNVSGINLGRLREKVKFYIEKVCDFCVLGFNV